YVALLRELISLRPLAFRASLDDATPVGQPGTLLAVANTASYGGGMRIHPGALPDDGLLDVVHVVPLTRRRLLRLFPLLLQGRHLDRAEVTARQAASVHVEGAGVVAYVDGERVGEGPVRVTIRPGALAMIVPG
ncbi:MAG: diacylglycerol kinase, partial [Mycolicibacterium fortuitum]